ncbi:MAG: TetR family transcriptional regulator [Phycisphaerales bacterium JB038]
MPRSAPKMPAKLAESAFRLFGQRGFDAVTIDEIALQAGVTKGSFYSHYRSKQDVILAACRHYYRTYLRRVHAELAALIDPQQRLHRVVAYSVDTCVADDHNRLFTTEVFALSLRDGDVRESWSQFYDAVRELYVGLLESAAPTVTADLNRQRVDLMLAAMEGVKMRAAFDPSICDTAERLAITNGLMALLLDFTELSPTEPPSTVEGMP